MKTRFFCTYFDHNYLPRAMVMLESLYEHNPHALVFVLCLSSQCYDVMQKLAYPFVRLISMHDFEAANPDLVAVRPTRSLVEYYFTMTPCLPWHILHTGNGIDAITYLDADMMFFSSVEPIFEEAGDASVILTPHNFAPHLMDRVRYGVYNVSWMTFCATQQGMDCLSWYKGKCLAWCFDRAETVNGEECFADQKYLDCIPKLFTGVHELRHKGAGLAPWNISKFAIQKTKHHINISGYILIFYHAQSFKPFNMCLYASGFSNYNLHLTPTMRTGILNPYCRAYKKNIKKMVCILNRVQFNSIRSPHMCSFRDKWREIYYEFKQSTLLFNV